MVYLKLVALQLCMQLKNIVKLEIYNCLVVRPNTGALMSGIKVIDAEPSINFYSIKKFWSSTARRLYYFLIIIHIFCKVATTVPTATTVAEIEASDWLDNFVQVEASGTVVQNLISFGANTSFKCGTTLYFCRKILIMQ